jgi:hypothetical protein
VSDRQAVHVFDSAGRFVRAMAYPVIPRFRVIREDGTATVYGTAQPSGGTGPPLHFLPREFRPVSKSFGSIQGGDPTAIPNHGRMVMAPSRDRGFWTADVREYRLVRWDSSGTARLVLRRNPDWWVVPERPRAGDTSAVAPDIGIRRIFEDPNGRIWVLSLVPGARWREGWGPRRPDGAYDITGMRFDLLYDTIIDVINPETARLITSMRTPGYIVDFVSADEILFTTEDDSGIPRAVVRKIRLNTPSTRH